MVRTELDPTSAIVKNQEQLAKTTEALREPTSSWMACEGQSPECEDIGGIS